MDPYQDDDLWLSLKNKTAAFELLLQGHEQMSFSKLLVDNVCNVYFVLKSFVYSYFLCFNFTIPIFIEIINGFYVLCGLFLDSSTSK